MGNKQLQKKKEKKNKDVPLKNSKEWIGIKQPQKLKEKLKKRNEKQHKTKTERKQGCNHWKKKYQLDAKPKRKRRDT